MSDIVREKSDRLDFQCNENSCQKKSTIDTKKQVLKWMKQQVQFEQMSVSCLLDVNKLRKNSLLNEIENSVKYEQIFRPKKKER